MNNLKELKKLLKGQQIIVVNTKQNKEAYHLAHVLRDFADITYCIDKTYKIKESPAGIRKIEQGKVFLLKGDWSCDKAIILNSIRVLLDGKPTMVFNVEVLK